MSIYNMEFSKKGQTRNQSLRQETKSDINDTSRTLLLQSRPELRPSMH